MEVWDYLADTQSHSSRIITLVEAHLIYSYSVNSYDADGSEPIKKPGFSLTTVGSVYPSFRLRLVGCFKISRASTNNMGN